MPPSTLSSPAVAPALDSLIHPIYARLLRMLLQQAAVDGDGVLALAGLDWSTLVSDDRPLPRETIIRLIEAALAASGRPWLGLELGRQAPVSAHGPLGYAAVTARDLSGALQVLARYGAVRNASLAWVMRPVAAGLHLQAVERVEWGRARGFYLDTVVAAMLSVIESALGQRPAGISVDMPLPTPAWAAQYQRFAPVQFRFGQPLLAMTVSAEAARLPCLGADAQAHASACRDCEAALAVLADRSLVQQVSALLAAAPAGAYPGLPAVAQACGLGPRTLMRRLAAEGSSFQLLLDAARRNRALWLLQHTHRSVEEVAAELGYQDTSNFSRTVRRWFGCTPGELRRPPASAAREPAQPGYT